MKNIIISPADLTAIDLTLSPEQLEKINAIIEDKYNVQRKYILEKQQASAENTAKKKNHKKECLIKKWYFSKPDNISIAEIAKGISMSENSVRSWLSSVSEKNKLGIDKFELVRN